MPDEQGGGLFQATEPRGPEQSSMRILYDWARQEREDAERIARYYDNLGRDRNQARPGV